MTEIAGIYCRLSVARYGDTTKVEDQERICRELAAARGWTVATGAGHPEPNGAYTDNNRSAWKRKRKRPGWDAMLADVGAGKLTALIVYHGDRLVRQPWDLEQLLNLADGKGIRLASPTGDRNLDDSQDRIMLRVLTAFACGSSDDTSRRKKTGFARMAREGKAPVPGGRFGRGFGYERDGRTPVPAERDALREAADRILGGEALAAIAASLTARGILSTSGRPLTYHTLHRILVRPRTAGLLTSGGQGTWEAILDRATWEAVTAELAARPAHRGAAPPRYLLSGIAACGACGARLQVHYTGRAPRVTAGYGCVRPGCQKVHRSMPLLDAYITERVVLKLNDPVSPEGHAPEAPGLAAQFAALAAQRGEAETAIADPANATRLHLLLARLDGIDHRLTELRELAGQDASGRLLTAHAGLTREAFSRLPLATRRALVSACFRVTVLPASRRGPGFNTADVRLESPGSR